MRFEREIDNPELTYAAPGLLPAMKALNESQEVIDLMGSSGVWAVSDWESHTEDPDFIAIEYSNNDDYTPMADIRFGTLTSNAGTKGAVFFIRSGLDVCNVLAVSLNLKIKNLADADGLVVRLVFDGEPAANAITTLDKTTTLNTRHHIRFSASDCPELTRAPVTLMIEVMPIWSSDMRGVHFQLDSIRIHTRRY